MRPPQLHDFFEREFEFPVDRASVLAQIGDATVDAPDDVDSDTIDEILASSDETFVSVDGLFESVIGNLDDDYIGRKFYDDRGANIEEGDHEYPHDDQNQSF